MASYIDTAPPLGDGDATQRTTTISATLERTLADAARDLVSERRVARRWKIFFRLLGFAVALMFLWALLSPVGKRGASATPHTALIEIKGEIALGGEASADALNQSLKSAFESPMAQAVVLRINSPGGSPVQSGMVNDEIRRLKAKHNKKVYAVVEEMCASGAYYIAVAADEIFVDKASLVGSIGVLMDGFGFTGAMEKLGVERRLLTAGANKGMLDPYSPQNDKHNTYAKALIDQVHQQFIKVVKDGRGERLKEQPDIFSGLFWNGEEAVRLGLVDKLGSLEVVARDVIKAEEIVDYTQHENVAERLARRFGAGMGSALVQSMRSATLR